jgi:hypothetical protein
MLENLLAGKRQSVKILQACDAIHNWRQARMLIKRLILAIISLGVGFGLTVLITILIGTSPAEYGPVYMTFTTLSLAVAIGIWLDKFMGTNILPR